MIDILISENFKDLIPIFFDYGEIGFYFDLCEDLQLIFHVRFEDNILEYILTYQGDPEEYGESPCESTIHGDAKFIEEIVKLYR